MARGKDRGFPERAAGAFLLAGLAVPLVYAPGLAFPWVVPRAVWLRLAVAGAALCVCAAVLGGRSRIRPPSDPLAWSLAAVLAVGAVAALAGVAPVRSLAGDLERMGGVLGWLVLAAWYGLLRTLLDRSGWRLLLRGVVLVTAAGAVVALLQWAGALPVAGRWVSETGVRAHAPLGNPGYLAIFQVMGAAAAVVVASDPREAAPWRGLAVAAGAAALAAVLAAATRAAALALALGAAAGAVTWLARTGRVWRRRAGAAAAGLVLVAAAAIGLVGPERVVDAVPGAERLTRISTEERPVRTRLMAWEAGIRAVRERPATGWGPENFRVAFDRHVDPEIHEAWERSVAYDRAHDVFVEAGVAGGIAGALSSLALALAALWTALRAGGSAGGRARPAEGAALVGATAAYGVFLLFWFHEPATAAVFLALVGYAAHRRAGRRWLEPAGEGAQAPGPGARITAGAAAALALAVALHAAALLRPARALGRAEAAVDLEGRIEALERAVATDVPGVEEGAARYAEMLGSLAPRAPALARRSRAGRLLDPAFASAGSALGARIARDPENARLRATRAHLRLAEGRFRGDRSLMVAAARAMREAVERAPGQLVYRYALSEMLRVVGRMKAAERVLREALAAAPGVADTRVHLARTLLQRGRPSEAADHLLAASGALASDADRMLARRLARTLPAGDPRTDRLEALGEGEGEPR